MKLMTKAVLLFTLACIAFLMAGAATVFADPIVLRANTSGSFAAGSSGATVGGGGSSITATAGGTTSTINFSSVTNQINVALNPGEVSNITLGVFNVTSNSRLPLTDGPSFGGSSLKLTVSFTVPGDVGAGVFTGNLTGRIIETASSTEIQWTSPLTLTFTSATGATFTLTIEPTTTINPPLTGGISNPPSQIRAKITVVKGPSPDVPEPATMVLLGSGLFGLAAFARRKFRAEDQEA